MKILALILVIVTSVTLAGCGERTEAPAAEPAAVVLMTANSLRAIVPEFDGWQRGTITAQDIAAPDRGDRAAHASAAYTRGVARLDLEITDTGGATSMTESLAHMAGSNVNRTVSNGYFKGTTIGGAPGVESWNTVDHLGEITLLVRDRYIIHVGGSGLADAVPLRALLERVDLTRLK